jgi:hypothetical protein
MTNRFHLKPSSFVVRVKRPEGEELRIPGSFDGKTPKAEKPVKVVRMGIVQPPHSGAPSELPAPKDKPPAVTRIAPGNKWESPGPWARWLTTDQAVAMLKAAIEKLEDAEAPLYVTDLFGEEGLTEENPLPNPPFNWRQL